VSAGAAWRLHQFATLPSTQDFCRTRAEAGEPACLAVLAGCQTAGRGTHGRPWQSPPGNLYLSVLLRPAEPARTLMQWSLLAAVALAQTLSRLVPADAALTCKWPNDLLLGGAKLAGVLVEAACAADGTLDWLVIGFGANLAHAPIVPDRPTACLAGAAPAPAAAPVARALLAELDHWQAVRRDRGFAPVRAAWLQRAPHPGTAMRLRQPQGIVDGGFAGLAADGALLLRTAAGLRRFVSGET
jgi:BirA family biotin operon repressor/biotin-[acetyl-CoA-carboxylase] ligase